MRLRLALLITSLLTTALLAQTSPITPRKPVTDTYHGVAIVDEYRWLENASDPAVRQWWTKQNQATEYFFKKLPETKRLQDRLEALAADPPYSYEKVQYANGVLCALTSQVLVVLKSADEPADMRSLVYPSRWIGFGRAVLDEYYLSNDGKYVAVSISRRGLEEGMLHVYETATGNKLEDQVPQAHTTAGSDVSWAHDNSGFYYRRFPNATPGGKGGPERYARQEIWFHKLGTKADEDKYICGRELPRYASLGTRVREDGKRILLGAANGWASDHNSWYLLDAAGKPELVVGPEERAVTVDFGPKDTLLLDSFKDAPRGRILLRSLADPKPEKDREIVPQSESVLYGWGMMQNLLYVHDRRDGSERLRTFDLEGKEQGSAHVPPHTAVEEIVSLDDDVLLYKVHGYRYPPTWFRYDPKKKEHKRTALSETWPAKFDDAEVVREWAVSRDGTKVPLTIVRRKDCKQDGDRPVLLTGYGGFRADLRPDFQLDRRVWLDHGGVVAIAHPRGDAELGDDWHRAAMLEKKQVCADDFLACAEHLIARKYTRPARLAIYGGSNGGLLMGMALTQRPDLFAAVLIDVGILDVLRAEQDAYGPQCIAEYGTVTNPKHFQAMLNYSPFHRVKDGTQYPAVWLRTGANDRRVDPKHTWKMAARLQASGTKNPVLLTTTVEYGHDAHPPMHEEYAFLFTRLGVQVRP